MVQISGKIPLMKCFYLQAFGGDLLQKLWYLGMYCHVVWYTGTDIIEESTALNFLKIGPQCSSTALVLQNPQGPLS